jgi:hypothetical protein
MSDTNGVCVMCVCVCDVCVCDVHHMAPAVSKADAIVGMRKCTGKGIFEPCIGFRTVHKYEY